MPNVFQTKKNNSFSTKKNLLDRKKYREENLTGTKKNMEAAFQRVLKSCFAKMTLDVPCRCPKN